MAAGSLRGQQRELHAGGAESVPGIPGAGQAPAEAGEGTACGSDGGGEDAYQGRVPQAGAHGESRGQGTDRHDHGDHVRHGDPRQRAEILPGGKCAERDGEGLE